MASSPAAEAKVASSGRPNVIIIHVDDMGYGDVGAFGNDDIATPQLDRLAADGIRFTAFFNSASGCTPSRAALLTGRYHMRSGVNFIPPPKTNNLSTKRTVRHERRAYVPT